MIAILKKILSVLMVILMVLTAVPLSSFVGVELPAFDWGVKASATNELAATGQCGDNVYWEYNSDTGELVISGSGDMWDYEEKQSPFYYVLDIKKLIIKSGITAIGDYAFTESSCLIGNLIIPEGVIRIGRHAFDGCSGFYGLLLLPNSLEYIGDKAFRGLKALTGNLIIPDNVTSIGDNAFGYCGGLTCVSVPKSVSDIGVNIFLNCKLSYVCYEGREEQWKEMAISEELSKVDIHYAEENKFSNYISDKNATCQSTGTKTAYCNVCGAKDTIVDDVKGDHLYEVVELVEVSCTTNGKAVYQCKYCTESYEEILKAGHIYYEAERIDSTCEKEGKVVYKCKNCTEFYAIVLPTHALYESERIDWTCTQDGKVVYKCQNCDYSEEKVYKASHLLIIKEYLEASCTKEGKRRGACTVCGMDVEEVIPATGHMWQNEYVLTKTPTCTIEGEEAIHCKTCWKVDEKTITVVPKLGHSWRETYEILDKPTCSKEGREAICCERCLAIKDGTERAIDKLSHTFVGWTLINGEEALYCTSCHCLLVDGVSDLMGRCGDNVYWQLNEITGELVISGSGDMWDYNNGISPFRGLDIKSVVVENGVTSIGNWAFLQCSSIKSVTLSNTITRIGQRAFETCDSIKSIVIPNSVKRIEKNAFMFCSNLTGIKFGDGLESIEYMAFAACINLEELDIPDSVTYIGPNAFDRCYSLQSVVIGDGLKSIEYGTFYRCYELADVTLGKNIYFIGDEAFYICVNLTNINIPDSVKIIGNYAFNCCFRLSDVIIPDSVTTIGEGAFQCCYGITNITIGSGVEEIRSYTFTDMPFLDKVIIKNVDVNIGENALCMNQIDPLNKSRDELLDLATVLHNADDPAIHEEWEKHCLKDAVYTGTIYCHKGSTAEKYAIDNGINYENVHFYNDWSYSYDNITRWRKCMFCDETETEQIGNKEVIIDETIENFRISNSTGASFELSWTGHNKVDGYQLAVYNSDSNTYSIISTTDKTTYTANNIEPYTCNKYVVRFYYEENYIRYCSKWSDEVVAGTIPNKGPENIIAKASCDSIRLEWNEIEGVCGYEVYQRKDPGVWISIGKTTSNYLVHKDLTENKSYEYKIRAFIGSESNPWYGNFADPVETQTLSHSMTDWVVDGDIATRTCKTCNLTETSSEPQLTGQCGDNVYWTFNVITGELVISGSGPMWDFEPSYDEENPFNKLKIDTIKVEDGVTTIGANSFHNHDYLTSVSLPKSLTVIGDGAFWESDSLTHINMPSNLKIIGYGAIKGTSVKSVEIPESVESIGKWAFDKCQNLEKITVDENNKHYSNDENGVLFNKDKTVLIQYPLGNSTKSYTVPDGVTTIKEFAFANCLILESVIIPDSVTSIGEESLFGSIKYVCYEGTQKQWEEITADVVYGSWMLTNFHYIADRNFSNYINDGNATCTTNETKTAYCPACGAKDTVEIENTALGHDYYVKERIEATCTLEGKVVFECKRCKVTYEEAADKLEHKWNEGYKIVTQPTCTQEGIEAIVCTVCDSAKEGSERSIEKHPHKFTDWSTEGNKSTRYCEVCNYTETKINTDGGDIEIEAPEQSDGTDFVVDEIVTGGKNYVVIEEAVSNGTDNSWEVIKAFDINLKNHDGVHVQPNGTVKVKLPNDWSKDGNYKVYRVNDDGTLTDMNAYRQGSHLVFDTDHFSIYVIVGESEKTDTPDEPEVPTTPEEPENPSDNCSCKCHKTGFFAKLIWKITIFFNKLFKKNKTCSCGVYHY